MRLAALPTLLTCGNLSAGFLAILSAVEGRFWWAALFVCVAAGLDLLDGSIARRFGSDDEFGCNLDSLADLVSFGVAPAVALYLALLQAVPTLGVAACIFYLVCGALRLARFPLVRNRHNFVGLPIPPAGVLASISAAALPALLPALALALVLGALMISEIPFPRRPGNLFRRRKGSAL